ncbi:redoxin family protein [Verrucomicrobiaceae bacterium N1E253]|uniref:Redoxin family protein n=1 Tax=Oceaniferula marina TaxID=2748318 RepID=A0A851GD00_9BACT|nr:redoxin family protein [Oceaniferula marina]NWK55628.1 redoxin family protein [Oceaniferula marina]
MKYFLLSLWIGLATISSCFAQLQVGDDAPALNFEHTAQIPDGQKAEIASLKGKAVVLEFWATWCGPCIASFPHLNHLNKKYQDKNVVFISVTHETPEVAHNVLKKKPLHTWLGFDTDDALRKAFGFKSLPQTVLISPEGKIAAITRPSELTPAVIDALIAGKALPEVLTEAIKITPGTDPTTKRTGLNILRETAYPQAKMSFNRSRDGTQLTLININAEMLYRILLQIQRTRIIGRELLEGHKFDLIINVKEQDELPQLADDLMTQLGFSIELTKRPLKTLVVKAGGKGGQNTTKNARRMEMKRIVPLLENYENTPVIDQSKLTDIYLSGLPKKGYITNLRKLIVDQDQLNISEKTQEIDVLVIEKLPKPHK